jgi:hypothetical protein
MSRALSCFVSGVYGWMHLGGLPWVAHKARELEVP